MNIKNSLTTLALMAGLCTCAHAQNPDRLIWGGQQAGTGLYLVPDWHPQPPRWGKQPTTVWSAPLIFGHGMSSSTNTGVQSWGAGGHVSLKDSGNGLLKVGSVVATGYFTLRLILIHGPVPKQAQVTQKVLVDVSIHGSGLNAGYCDGVGPVQKGFGEQDHWAYPSGFIHYDASIRHYVVDITSPYVYASGSGVIGPWNATVDITVSPYGRPY